MGVNKAKIITCWVLILSPQSSHLDFLLIEWLLFNINEKNLIYSALIDPRATQGITY